MPSQQLIYDVLSSVPSSLYKISYREAGPNQAPADGFYSSGQQVRISLSAGPRDFVFPESAKLECDSYSAFKYPDFDTAVVKNWSSIAYSQSTQPPAWRPGVSIFDQCQETVGSGSMTLADYSDSVSFLPANVMRGLLSKGCWRYEDTSGGINFGEAVITVAPATDTYSVVSTDMENASCANDVNRFAIEGLEGCGFDTRKKRVQGMISKRFTPTVVGLQEQRIFGAGGRKWIVPLSAISEIFRAQTMAPLGLMSTYSSEAFTIQLRVSQPSKAIELGAQALSAGGAEVPSSVWVVDPKITYKVLTVLDDSLMDRILSLYNKSEVEVANGMRLPLSLNISTLHHNIHTFSLRSNQSSYQVRVPCNSASLRGLAFAFFPSSLFNGYNQTNARFPLAIGDATNSIVLQSLHVKIGSECLMQNSVRGKSVKLPGLAVGEDVVYTIGSVNQWLADNVDKAGHLFSLRAPHKDAVVRDGPNTYLSAENQDVYIDYDLVKVHAFSFENMDHSELMNASTGIDCRSYGAVDLQFELGAPVADQTERTGQLGLPSFDMTMVVMTCVDRVLEVSRAGIKDVTDMTI